MNILDMLNSPKYPTKEEILAGELKHKKKVIAALKDWKKIVWTNWRANKLGREKDLRDLFQTLNQIYEGKPHAMNLIFDRRSCFAPALNTISLDKPSLISFLHEYAHSLFGPSELKACRWSVRLFKKVFPKAMNKLKWKGHMLIKTKKVKKAA